MDLFLATRQAGPSSIRWYAERLAHTLEAIEQNSTNSELEVRVPEGFAWYALYPDSYAQTSERWARQYGPLRPSVAVIGLRTIGTSLAAVVAQMLRRCGIMVTSCISLRTTGAPFSRKAELPAEFVPATYNIIVDEGPGLSGSSMVAVGRALEEAGASRERIHFFCGHAKGPGPPADGEVCRWWSSSRIWTTHPDSTIIHGRPLPDTLAVEVAAWAGEPAAGPVEPLGPEGWMARAGLGALPRAIAPVLETPKKLIRLTSGRAVVLKFAGFDLSSTGLWNGELPRDCPVSLSPLGVIQGWAVMPWVEGVRLSAQDGTVDFISRHLGPWIAQSALGEMPPGELREALNRIRSAIAAWAMSRGRNPAAVEFDSIVEREVVRSRAVPQRCYGDGRLAPHEWIRTAGGDIRKADWWPHQRDHTWVGRQPIGWDLAGAEIEWELDEQHAAALRQRVLHLTGYACSEPALAFFKAGYCAFRAAAAYISAVTTRDPRLRAHLFDACEWYEGRLEGALVQLQRELAFQ